MAFFLGIDGGGTGCRAALADDQGRILGQGAAGPANIATDPRGAERNILTAAQSALREAGLASADKVSAVLGLAGANVSASARALTDRLPFARIRVVSDAVTAATGALQGADGIVAAMGTGSVFAVQRGGLMQQYGGRGFLLGDEGSGAVLGRTLLTEALRAEDGFASRSPLLSEVLRELGGVEGVIAFGLRARPADFAAFAPRVIKPGDPAAERIFAAAVAEIGAMIDRLQHGAPLPVVFLGGVGPAYAAALAGRWPIHPALGSGLDGALLLARQEV